MHSVAPTMLTRVHYAALRAWLQDLPLDVIAGRWLATDPDDVPGARATLAMLHTIRDALVQRARLHGREDLANASATPGRSGKSMDRAIEAVRSFILRGRLLRVALLLLRETGMRCSEAANATRDNLVPRQANGAPAEQRAVWGELRVLGKGNRERMVPISRRLVAALEAYWQDRKAINRAPSEEPLIAPLAILKTPRARSKQRQCRHGYSDRGLRQLVNDAAEKFGVHLAQENPELLADMGRIHPHAFRHAFGSHGLAAGMALNVMQGYLGHASIATTTLYSTADRDRRLQDVEKFYRGS